MAENWPENRSGLGKESFRVRLSRRLTSRMLPKFQANHSLQSRIFHNVVWDCEGGDIFAPLSSCVLIMNCRIWRKQTSPLRNEFWNPASCYSGSLLLAISGIHGGCSLQGSTH